jgi:hypothetical protein
VRARVPTRAVGEVGHRRHSHLWRRRPPRADAAARRIDGRMRDAMGLEISAPFCRSPNGKLQSVKGESCQKLQTHRASIARGSARRTHRAGERLVAVVLDAVVHCKIRDITTVINTAYALSSGTNSTRRGILAEHLAKQQVDLRPPQIEQIPFCEKERVTRLFRRKWIIVQPCS